MNRTSERSDEIQGCTPGRRIPPSRAGWSRPGGSPTRPLRGRNLRGLVGGVGLGEKGRRQPPLARLDPPVPSPAGAVPFEPTGRPPRPCRRLRRTRQPGSRASRPFPDVGQDRADAQGCVPGTHDSGIGRTHPRRRGLTERRRRGEGGCDQENQSSAQRMMTRDCTALTVPTSALYSRPARPLVGRRAKWRAQRSRCTSPRLDAANRARALASSRSPMIRRMSIRETGSISAGRRPRRAQR